MIRIGKEDFSVDEAVGKMRSPSVGAIVTYVGTVREFLEGTGLEFESSSNALQRLEDIRERAISEFDVEDVAIIHRTGFLRLSENILLVAVSAAHRGPAFDSCKHIVDEIKVLHESWKREVRTSASHEGNSQGGRRCHSRCQGGSSQHSRFPG